MLLFRHMLFPWVNSGNIYEAKFKLLRYVRDKHAKLSGTITKECCSVVFMKYNKDINLSA
jgi:hypothetical protein